MTRTLLLGIDGADPDLMDEFDLPHIESIGEFREIDTHGNSGPSWVSVLTGLKPRSHGIQALKPQQSSQTWEGTPIWEKIDGYCGVANVPLTYPPSDAPRWIVTGLMTPQGAIYTYPPELSEDLNARGYRVDIWVDNHQNHPDGHYGTVPFRFGQKYKESLLGQAREVIEGRGRGFRFLLEERPVDFAFVVFTSLDRVQHLAFDDRETVREFYEMVDEEVGKLLASDGVTERTEIVACSDHGFQRIDAKGSDLTGEHRHEGWATANFEVNRAFRNLEDVHQLAVESANRSDVEGRLDDLGYLE